MLSLILSAIRLLMYYFCFAGPDTAYGWGSVGHQIVGEIAWSRLSAQAQFAVSDILFSAADCYPQKNSSLLPSPLAQISTWADYIRHVRGYYWTTPLHFIDVQETSYQDQCKAFSNDCKFVYHRDCINDVCVAGAIANYTQQIKGRKHIQVQHEINPLVKNVRTTRKFSRRETQKQKIPSCSVDTEALMFVTHFVGDIHQPLHVSRKSDYGGNSIHVYFPTKKMRLGTSQVLQQHRGYVYTNLHKVWDEDMIHRVLKDAFEDSEEQLYEAIQEYLRENSAEIDSWLICGNAEDIICTSSWAEESLDLALSIAYADTKTKNDIEEGSLLSEDYYNLGLIVITRRLAQAGVRLAYILETMLGNQQLLPST